MRSPFSLFVLPSILLFLAISHFSSAQTCALLPVINGTGSNQSYPTKCAPVNATLDYTIRFATPLPVGPAYRITFNWGDGSPNTIVVVVANGVQTIFTSTQSHIFPGPVTGECDYQVIMQFVVNGSACVATTRQQQIIPSWRTEEYNQGLVQLIDPISGTNVHQVCEGVPINVTFNDLTNFNCNANYPSQVPPGSPILDPNQQTRWQQIVYNTNNPAVASRIPNVRVNGVLMPAAPGSNYQDTRGVFLMTPLVVINDGRRRASLPITAPGGFGAGFPVVGDEFQITIRYWNFCNPYDNPLIPGLPADLINGDSPPVERTAFIRIIDSPNSPTVPDRDVCSGESRTISVSPTVGGLTYRWYATQANALANVSVLATATTFTPSTAQAPLGQRTHFFVTAGVTAALGNCRSFPTEVTIIRRPDLTSPTPISGPTNLCPTTVYTFSVPTGAPPNPPDVTITDPIGGNVNLATDFIWTVPAGWVINSGQNTNSINVTTGGAAAGTISVIQQYETNTSFGTRCPSSPATTLGVTVRARPTANITPDPANICQGTVVPMNGNPATSFGSIFSHTWGGSTAILDATNIQQPNIIAAAAPGPYGLTYFVTADFGGGVFCASTVDASVVNISANTLPAAVGANQNLCFPIGPLVSNPLGGSNPAPGTGAWTKVSGPGGAMTFLPTPTTANATATAPTNGIFVLRWTVTNGSCTSFADITVDYGTTPPASTNGGNQDVCSLSATLTGSDPTFATGTWTQTAGTGTSSFSPNANTRNAVVTATTLGTKTYRWRVASGTCPFSDSFLDIVYRQAATVTGPADFTFCVDNPPTVTIPLSGTFGGGASQARWERVTGTGTFTSNGTAIGNFDNTNPATDIYTPTAADFAAGSIQVRLVTDDPIGACPAVNFPVNITIDRRPANANAGVPIFTCDPNFSLAATAATNGGTGTWTVGNALFYETFADANGVGLTGPNPHALTFTHPSTNWNITAPTTATLLAIDDYLHVEGGVMEAQDVNAELVWRSKSINITAIPNITVSIQLAESGTMEPGDYIRAFYRLNGAGPEIPIGSIVDDAAVDGVFNTFSVTGITGTSIEIIVRVLNDAALEFYRFDNVFVSGSGAVLPFIANVNSPTSSVTGLPVGATTFTWTVTSALGVCSSSNSPVIVTRHAAPVNNPQSPSFCEDVPTGGTATVTLAFLNTLNNAITGGAASRTVAFFEDAARLVPYPASKAISNAEVVYTRVTRTDVTPNCTTDGTVTFTINVRPTVVNQTPEFCENLPVGSNTRTGIDLTSFNLAIKNGVVANTVAWFLDVGRTVPVPVPTNVTANDGTTFFARITNPATTCTNDATLDITLNGIPVPNALIGPDNVCVSATGVNLYQLTTNNIGYTYTWSIPGPPFNTVLGGGVNDFLVLLNFPVVVNPGQDISVIEISDKGCVGEPNLKNITVESSPPVIAIAGPAAVCEGESGVVYTVANLANTTYAWTVPAGSSIISGQGTFQISVNFASTPGLITVVPTTTAGSCPGNPANLAVAINPRPSLDILTNTVCSDTQASITLSGVGATTFNITNVSVPPGLSPASRPLINNALSSEIFNDIFTNTTGGNLTVQYTVVPVSAANCKGTAQIVNLTIRPEPVLASNLNDEICSTSGTVNIVLNVAAGSFPADQYEVFSVNNPSGLTPLAGNPTTLGIFTSAVLLDDKWQNTTGAQAIIEYFIRPINSTTGCVGDPPIPVIVRVNPEPVINPVPNEIICSGDKPTTLITPSIAGSTYSWSVKIISGTVTGGSSGSGPAGSAITDVLINNSGVAASITYTLIGKGPGALGSCNGQPVDFVVNVNPSPTANSISQTVCSDTPGGNTFFIDLTTLQNSVNSGGGIAFTWFNDLALTSPIAVPTVHTLTSGVPVFVNVNNGQCSKVATILFTINPSPSVTASITSNYTGFQLTCNGASDGQITAVPANGTGPYQFSINGGVTFFNSAIFNGLAVAGNPFIIRVKDINGCIRDSAPLSIVPPPALTAAAAKSISYNGQDVSCQTSSNGQITVTANGGTGAGTYTYRLLELPGNITGDANGIYTGLGAGTYTFIARDANGCQFTTPTITVTEPSAITASAVLTSPVSCNGNSDGVITITAAGGTLVGPNYSYALNQAPFTVNATGVFSGLGAGVYTVNVTDDNSCVKTSNSVTVTQPSVLTAFASITSNYNGAKISCPGANDGQVTAIANGGNGGYSFALNQAPFTVNATGVFSGLGPGTYSVTVTDAGTCFVTSASVVVSEPTPIVPSGLVTGAISCNAGSDGQITLSASGGTGAYSFTQTNPAGPTNGSGIFSALAQGTYDFTVSDLNLCSAPVQVTINQPTPVTASSAVTSNYNGAQISCTGANNGIITVTGAGGTGLLTYVFDQFVLTNTTGQLTGVFSGVPPGVGYTFTVKDTKNCSVGTVPINVTEPTPVTGSELVTSNYNGQQISCVGSSDGRITVTAAGGTGVHTYKLDQVPSNTTGDITGIYTGLSAGIYTVTIKDVNNCFIVTAPITISPPPTLTASALVTSNYNGRQISCNGASDGIITVTAGGGVPAYGYLLIEIPGNVTGAASGIFTGIPAGTYTIRVRDLNSCQQITTAVTISEPTALAASSAVTSNYSGQQISCNGASDGIIKVTATGGTTPYSFTFVEIPGNVTGAATGTFTGIPAGAYTFNVRDVNNCLIATVPVTIAQPTPVIASAAVTSNYNGSQISCFGLSDGVIKVTASGGTGVLQYVFDQDLFNTTGQFSGIFTGVSAGVGYTFTVRDVNNCSIGTIAVSVVQPTAVTASGLVTSNYNGQQISCVGASDGQITVTALGGTGAYNYKLDQVPSTTSGDATGIYTGLSAGTYTITARDINSCFIITAPITISPPPALTASALVTSNYNGRQVSCNGASDGIITVTPGGGVPAYTFVLVEIPGNVTGAASGIFTGVPAGTYTIQVRDLNLCQKITTSVTISEPVVLAASSAVTSNYNGEQISCNGASDGIIKITPSGGTTPYTYTFVEIPGNITGAATGIFSGIPAGTYTFNVRDVNNCLLTTAAITVSQPTPVIITSRNVTSNYLGSQISCNGLSDGEITIVVSGGTGAYTYVFDQIPANQSGRFSGIFTGIPAGTGYTFTVSDANGCPVATAPIDVTQPVALTGSGLATSDFNGFDVRCFTETNGQITVTALGGNGALTYLLLEDAGNVTGQTTGIFDNLRAGSFRARITDVNGCLFTTAPIIVTQPNNLALTINKTINYNGFDVSCIGASDGQISVITTTGGAGGYVYALDGFPGNISGQASGVFTGVASGLYTITVTDVNTCFKQSLPVILSDPLPLFEGIVGLDKAVCQGADPTALTVLAPAFGGIGNYAFQWQQSTDNISFANIAGATSATFDPPVIPVTTFYKRLITSGTCTTLESNVVTVTVNPLPTLTFAPSKSPVCEGDFFLLEFTFMGQAPFYFDYDDGTTFVNDRLGAAFTPVPVINYTSTKTYTVTEVRDFNGCVAPALPLPIIVPVIKINPNFIITSPAAQCSGGVFDFQYTVDPDVEYTWIWGDGQQDVILANSSPFGLQPISHTYVSFNTSGTTNFPVILQAINTVAGCGPNQTSKTVQIFPNIVISLFPNKTEICGGDQVTFTNPTAGGTTHHWFYRRQGFVEMLDERTFVSASTQTFTFNNTSAQNPIIYELVYEVSNTNCAANTVIPITVYREVAASFSKTTPVPLFIGGFANMTFTNTSVPIDGVEFRYDWDFGTAAQQPPVSGIGPFNFNYTAPGTKTVNLIATNLIALGNGVTCTSQYQETFDILLPPLIADFTYTPQSACFPANIAITQNNATGDQFTWRLVDGTGRQLLVSNDLLPTFTISNAGRYTIFLTTTNTLTGQSASADNSGSGVNSIGIPIDIYAPPFAGFEARPTVVFVPDTELRTFNFSSSALDPQTNLSYPIDYKWYFGDGADTVRSEFEPAHFYTNEGNYTIALIAYNDHGNGIICRDTATQKISAKAAGFTRVPNAFTPGAFGSGGSSGGGSGGSGNTVNDVFLPIAKGILDFQMQIYDRWGNLVFESLDKTKGWDGFDRHGNILPAGVYVYKLVLRLSNEQRTTQIGDVTLIR